MKRRLYFFTALLAVFFLICSCRGNEEEEEPEYAEKVPDNTVIIENLPGSFTMSVYRTSQAAPATRLELTNLQSLHGEIGNAGGNASPAVITWTANDDKEGFHLVLISFGDLSKRVIGTIRLNRRGAGMANYNTMTLTSTLP